MFLVNSRLGLLSATPSGFHPNGALLLPKLRSHFAEFLNKGSLARLRILSSPTCGGFSTGISILTSSFSWQPGISCFGLRLLIKAQDLCETDLPVSLPNSLNANYQIALNLSFCVTTSLKHIEMVQEYQPVVHRLRLSASP